MLGCDIKTEVCTELALEWSWISFDLSSMADSLRVATRRQSNKASAYTYVLRTK